LGQDLGQGIAPVLRRLGLPAGGSIPSDFTDLKDPHPDRVDDQVVRKWAAGYMGSDGPNRRGDIVLGAPGQGESQINQVRLEVGAHQRFETDGRDKVYVGTENALKFRLNPGDAEQPSLRWKLDKDVDIAARVVIASSNTAEDLRVGNPVS